MLRYVVLYDEPLIVVKALENRWLLPMAWAAETMSRITVILPLIFIFRMLYVCYKYIPNDSDCYDHVNKIDPTNA